MFSRLLLVLIPLLLFSCGAPDPDETKVGSGEEIPWLSFFPETCYVENGSIYAEGIVQNQGTETIEPLWCVEAQFYSDSTFSLKLGGNCDTILVPLEPGMKTVWRIRFNSEAVDEENYPEAAASNYRGVY